MRFKTKIIPEFLKWTKRESLKDGMDTWKNQMNVFIVADEKTGEYKMFKADHTARIKKHY